MDQCGDDLAGAFAKSSPRVHFKSFNDSNKATDGSKAGLLGMTEEVKRGLSRSDMAQVVGYIYRTDGSGIPV